MLLLSDSRNILYLYPVAAILRQRPVKTILYSIALYETKAEPEDPLSPQIRLLHLGALT